VVQLKFDGNVDDFTPLDISKLLEAIALLLQITAEEMSIKIAAGSIVANVTITDADSDNLADELVNEATGGEFQPLEPHFTCVGAKKLSDDESNAQQTMTMLALGIVIIVFLLLLCLVASSKCSTDQKRPQQLPPGWEDDSPPLADVAEPASAQPLPGWVVRCNAAGSRYYYNVETGETASTEGAWEKRDPGNGRVYWRNRVTKEITFIEPSGVGAALSGETALKRDERPWHVEYPPYHSSHSHRMPQFSAVRQHDIATWSLDPKDLLPTPQPRQQPIVPDKSTMERVRQLETRADMVATKAEQDFNFRSTRPYVVSDRYWRNLGDEDPLASASHALQEMRGEFDSFQN
jgi:hypothetical protein